MITHVERQLIKKIFCFLFLLICSQILISANLLAQDTKSYFEQVGDNVFIEAEHKVGFGWEEIYAFQASDNSAILFSETNTVIVPVSEDTYINYYNQDSNYGNSAELSIDGRGGIYRGFYYFPYNGTTVAFEKASFLKFNVDQLSNTIVEAKVFLYCVDSGIGGGIYALDSLLDDLNWNEYQATWNNRPSKHYDANTFQSYLDYVEAGNWYSFDVTESLNGKSNGSYSYGIVTQNNYYTEWSSKEGANSPYLELKIKKTKYHISGNVLYYSNNNPIPNVQLQLSGGQQNNETSQELGYYAFSNLGPLQDYLINASKPENQDVGALAIQVWDAALTAQAAVGIITLTENQQIAADVTLNGIIRSYDASLIAQYAVGLPKVSASHAAEWVFQPDTNFYESLNGNLESQNYSGIILGNVHGEWNYPASSIQKARFKKYDLLTDINTDIGEEFEIPIEVKENQNLISSEIDFSYDSEVLDLINVEKTPLTMEMNMITNDEPGRIRIGIYGTQPLTQSGTILLLKFSTKETKKKVSNLLLKKFQINNNVFLKAESVVKIGAQPKVPERFKLSQNYPNPFFLLGNQQNNKQYTVINYEIPHQTKIQLNVFNYLGQKVKTFVDSEVAPGSHTIKWNGRDENGEILSSGIYFYCMKTAKKTIVKRMVLIQ